MALLVRTDGDPLRAATALREAVRRLDDELPIAGLTTVERMMTQAQSTRRFVLGLLLLFAAVAATLAAVGIYGVMAYLVSRRTREVGVRMAVGADRGDVVGLILRDAARQVLPGIAIGLLGAMALARLLRSQLYGVGPTDPLTLGAVALVLTAIALAASWIPAYRAARTDPLEALRME
jgi:ABC-type antimicrobial peptide transport system permease subunit